MKKTRLITLLLIATFLLATAGCGQKGTEQQPTQETQADSPASEWPSKKPITINCGSAGGTVDLRVRTLAPYLESILGQTIVVVNHDGNDLALNDALVAEPDGYSWATLLNPDIQAYLNPSSPSTAYKPDDFGICCQFLADHVICAVRTDDERFVDVNDLKSFQEYLQNHPDENILAAVSKEGSVHYISYSNLNNLIGTSNFIGVTNSGGVSVRKTSFLSKDVDVYFGSIADTAPMIEDGTAKPLAIFSSERASVLPDLATCKEQGFDLDSNHSRGFVTNPNVDQQIIEKFSDAVKTASENPDYIAELAEVLDAPGYLNTEDYKAMLNNEAENYKAMLKSIGLI